MAIFLCAMEMSVVHPEPRFEIDVVLVNQYVFCLKDTLARKINRIKQRAMLTRSALSVIAYRMPFNNDPCAHVFPTTEKEQEKFSDAKFDVQTVVAKQRDSL